MGTLCDLLACCRLGDGTGRKGDIVDKAVAYVVLAAASPVLAVRSVRALVRTGHVVEGEAVVGRDGQPLRLLRFAGEKGSSDLLHLTAVARGDLRLVGPRPLTGAELEQLPPQEDWRRHAVPGLFSPRRLQQQLGIDYDGDAAADRALAEGSTVTTREGLALVARSFIASSLTGRASAVTPEHLRILDVSIANKTMQEAIDWVFEQTRTGAAASSDGAGAGGDRVGAGRLVCFVNPSCLNISVQDIGYRAVLHRASLVLPDGIGIKVATRMQAVGLRENVNGTDLFPRLCERAAAEGTPLYLLGARDGVAAEAGRAMTKRYPGLRIVGTHHGYIAGEEDEVVAAINASGAQILLVAMGVPQQELWLERMRPQLRPAVLMGVGGLFDFYSGRIPRAPLWVREIGMEWVWRLMQEPGRMWRRYVIGNPLFLFRVWRDHRFGPKQTLEAGRPAAELPAADLPAGTLPATGSTPAAQVGAAETATTPPVAAAARAQASASTRAVNAVLAARRRAASSHRRRDSISTDT